MKRIEAISLLENSGCKHSTHPDYPNQTRLKYNFGESSYIYFDFGYPDYDYIYVSTNKRRVTVSSISFNELKFFLQQQGILNSKKFRLWTAYYSTDGISKEHISCIESDSLDAIANILSTSVDQIRNHVQRTSDGNPNHVWHHIQGTKKLYQLIRVRVY